MLESLSQCLSHPLFQLFSQLILPLFSLLVGSLVARRYYMKEAARLHRTSSAILYRLENPKASIKFRRDAAGYVVGWDVTATGTT